MLGRVGSGCTVAALPWAATLVAATEGALDWATAAGVLTAAIMAWTFAPWIPLLRDLLPARRRIAVLERAYMDGSDLKFDDTVQSDADFDKWKARRLKWHTATLEWIAGKISPIEARRFTHPAIVSMEVSGSHNHEHSDARNHIGYQLDVLIRLRDEQEGNLR